LKAIQQKYLNMISN